MRERLLWRLALRLIGRQTCTKGKSKRKDRPVGPISLDDNGHPYGPHYGALVDRISQHVTHAEEFPPALTWPDHKNAGRVHLLYTDMAEAFSLPPWNDTSKLAKDFRGWFNDNVWHKWNDNKNRSLCCTLVHCQGSIAEAAVHPPAQIDSETWASLLSTYEKNVQPVESGSSKSDKCRASRSANEYDHRMGRDTLSVWKGKFRDVFYKDPNPVHIYEKEYLKIDALDNPEGGQPTPRTRVKPVSPAAEALGVELVKNYQSAISECSDESTASMQAIQQTFGRISRLGMRAPRGGRTGKRDAYTVQLEERVQTLSQESVTSKERIANLEASQKEMQQLLAQLMASQQNISGGYGINGGVGSGQGSDSGSGDGSGNGKTNGIINR